VQLMTLQQTGGNMLIQIVGGIGKSSENQNLLVAWINLESAV